MHQYQKLGPKYKQLEGVDQQLKQVQAQYKQLKAQATGGTDGDVKYWRDKYHELLVETEG
jgi:hypothetical protein